MAANSPVRKPKLAIFDDRSALRDLIDGANSRLGSMGKAYWLDELLPAGYSEAGPAPGSGDARHWVLPIAFGVHDIDFISRRIGRAKASAAFRAADRFVAGWLKKHTRGFSGGASPVFVQSGDSVQTLPSLRRGLVFKNSANFHRPRELGFPYLFHFRHLARPIQTATQDFSFQGSSWGMRVRQNLPICLPEMQSVGMKGVITFTDCRPSTKMAESSYLDQMSQSRFVLCPRGWGLSSVRFFETLALGRIPVLLSDHLRLPLEGVIPYERFVVRVPERELIELPRYLLAFTRSNSLPRASALARKTFLKYFADENWDMKKFMIQSLSQV